MFKIHPFLWSFVLLSFNQLHSQSTPTFNRLFGETSFLDAANDIISYNDGFAIAGSESNDSTKGEAARLTFANALGEPIKNIYFDNPGQDRFYAIAPTIDGNLILGGFSEASRKSLSDAVVSKFDENGNLLWSKTYGGSYRDEVRDIISLLNGDIIMVIETYRLGSEEDILIQKTDSTGEILWSQYLSSNNYDSPDRVLYTVDNQLYVTGFYNRTGFISASNTTDSPGIVSRINPNNGEIIWQKVYDNTEITDINISVDGENLAVLSRITRSESEIKIISPEGDSVKVLPLGRRRGFNIFPSSTNNYIILESFKMGVFDGSTGNPIREILDTRTSGTTPNIQNSLYINDQKIVLVGFQTENGSWDSYISSFINGEVKTSVFGKQKVNFNERIQTISPALDGGYFISLEGFTFLSRFNQNRFIMLNELGETIWTINEESADAGFQNGVSTTLTNGNFLVTTRKSQSPLDTFVVHEISPEGAIVWKKEYSMTRDILRCEAMVTLANGDHLFAMPFRNGSEPYTTTLLRISPNGDSLSRTQLEAYPELFIYDAKLLPNGDVLLAGWQSLDFDEPVVIRLNQNLEVIWGNTQLGAGGIGQFHGIELGANNEIFISGFTNAATNTNQDSIYVAQLNNDGMLSWETYIALGDYAHINPKIHFTSNEELLISSFGLARDSVDFVADDNVAMLLVLNTSGEVLREEVNQFEDVFGVSYFSTRLLPDGTIVRAGTASGGTGKINAFISVVSGDGIVPTFEPQAIGALKLFPQPSRTDLKLEFSNDWKGEIGISVYNLQGQQISSRIVDKNAEILQIALPTHHLPHGNYVLRIQQGKRSMSQIFSKQ